jgi:hypothetical protein
MTKLYRLPLERGTAPVGELFVTNAKQSKKEARIKYPNPKKVTIRNSILPDIDLIKLLLALYS